MMKLAPGPNRLLDRPVAVDETALAHVQDGPCQVMSAICWQTTPDWHITARTCPDTLLFISLDGQVDLTMRGRTRRVVPGDLAIVPARARHTAVYAPGCTSWKVIAVHALHTDAYAADIWAGFTDTIHQVLTWTERLLDLTAAVNRGAAGRLGPLVLRSLASELLLRGAGYSLPQSPDPRIAAALTALDEDPSITVKALAKVARLGPAHFRARFAALLGESPKAYQLRRRLERACQLLRGTAEPVQAIADELGFASDHHFSQAFKAAYGLPPARWRQRDPGI